MDKRLIRVLLLVGGSNQFGCLSNVCVKEMFGDIGGVGGFWVSQKSHLGSVWREDIKLSS